MEKEDRQKCGEIQKQKRGKNNKDTETVPINAALETFENREEKPFPILRYDGLLLCCSFLHSVPAALPVRVLIKWIANFIYFRMNFLPDTLTIGQLMKITFYIFKVLLKKQHLY